TRSTDRRGSPRGAGVCRGALHGQPSLAVLLVSPRRLAGRADGGRDQRAFGAAVAAAASIARLARPSASLLDSRRACSNVTRPMSWASTRAFPYSGSNPACFTL